MKIQEILIILIMAGIIAAAILGGEKPSGNAVAREWDGQMRHQEALDRPVWVEPRTGMEFVWVDEGCYAMGCVAQDPHCDLDEHPVHEVCLDGFWMGRFPVTRGQWQRIAGKDPSSSPGHDDYPVNNVSWHDVQDFISRLNAKHENGSFGLPTEAQWEYACRSGGKAEHYSGSSDPEEVAWHIGNSGGSPQAAGKRMPNGLGLHDMSGNVGEWVQDVYDKDAYTRHEPRNPLRGTGLSPEYDIYLKAIEAYIGDASQRVIRGGSWNRPQAEARCTNRDKRNAGARENALGVRLVIQSAPASGSSLKTGLY